MSHGWEISDEKKESLSFDTGLLRRKDKETIREGSSATLEFAFHWKSMQAAHTDCYFAQEVGFSAGSLPGTMIPAFMGKAAEDLIFLPGASDILAAPFDPSSNLQIDKDRLALDHTTALHFGRFYPNEIIGDRRHIPADAGPVFRCTGIEGGSITADFNHPLSGENIDLSVFVHDVRSGSGVNALPVTDWLALSAMGPGMQARWLGRPTDFLSGAPFLRADESDDRLFYEESRLVHHIDRRAGSIIGGIYGNFLRDDMKVLDLMSSWQSRIPGHLKLESLTGLGMNVEEMSLNLQLTDQIVHDLNRDPHIPFGDSEFDAVVCTASAEYLTRPLEVFEDVARVLRQGGYFLVTFSNRWFPSKITRVWTELMEFERIGLVLEYFLRAEKFSSLETFSIRGLPRPESDRHYPAVPFSDPVYAVWGRKA